MRLAILTQYYPPETGAPQNRLHSLAKHLQAAGHDVHVITAMPNYPKMRVFDGYRGRLMSREAIEGVPVYRSWIFASTRKGIVPRLLSYFSFVATALVSGARSPRADYVLCESPPLFLGITAVLLSWMKGARLVFNVSDLWPESAEKLGIVTNRRLLGFAYRLEAWLYRRAALVTGQTQGIVSDITRRFPSTRTFWLPNGVDRDVYESVAPDRTWRAAHGIGDRKVFMYAGIVGHAQGLEVLIRAAARLRERRDIAIVVAGDGPVRDELIALNQQLGAGVVFLPGVPRREIMPRIADAYAGIVCLKKLPLFLGAIPSKIFDPLALGVPILLAVDGEARTLFIEQGQGGLFVEPEDDARMAAAILKLADDAALRDSLGERGRAYVRAHFSRDVIAAGFARQIAP